ncbi:MAG: hypothetical protein M0Z58_04150 [Nitrospiraceae bacterium]|nr:hypothetical protein [Nitrospiraceae bacterium]
MRVLILKNTPNEGPGTIEDYLGREDIPFDTVELLKGGDAPAGRDYTHVVMMGGPMAVYEMEIYPHLEKGARLLEGFLKNGASALGVCLGAQMLAHVLGAKVYAGGGPEVGWYEVDMTPEGTADEVFRTLSVDGQAKARVFQWHGDTFDLPAGVVRLASSALYRNQAFRWGKGVYALQFHIEVTPAIIAGWFEGGKDFAEAGKLFDQGVAIYPEYAKRAMGFYRAFFS